MWKDRELANYIVGQADADSSFYIALQKAPQMEHGIQIRPTFQMAKVVDLDVLEKIRDFLGVGHICQRKKKRGNFSLDYIYSVRGRDSLKVVKFFDEFPLRGSKHRDFEIWKKAVLIHNTRRRSRWNPMTKEEFVEMLRLRKQLDELPTRKKGIRRSIATELLQDALLT